MTGWWLAAGREVVLFFGYGSGFLKLLWVVVFFVGFCAERERLVLWKELFLAVLCCCGLAIQ